MLREALTYPARADEQTLLVGTALAVLSGLLLRLGPLALLAIAPAILLAGYALAVLRETAASDTRPRSDDVPPRFAGFRKLAGDGLRVLVVVAGYLLVPFVALALTVGGAGSGSVPTNVGTTVFFLGASTVVLFVSLAFAYLLPAALAGVARTGHVRAAVQREQVFRYVTNGRYFLGWVTALVLAGITGLLWGSIAGLGRVGEVVALALGFYAVVVVARLLGRGTS